MKISEVNTVTVKAGATLRVDAAGFFFFCSKATTAFKMRFDAGEKFDCESRFSIKLLGAENPFQSITFYNPGAVDISITYYAGSSQVDFSGGGPQIIAPTILVGDTQNLGAGAKRSYSGSLNGLQRKQIWVRNKDAGGLVLTLQDSGGNTVEELAAGDPPWTIETSDELVIYNPGGAAMSKVIVGQTFYL